jgi:shikimate kinase
VGAASVVMLIGLRGSGKSTLGRYLAEQTGRTFVDLDVRTLARLGEETVREAWWRLGEPAFRAAEVEALRDALRQSFIVLSLGGGTPLAPGAREQIETARREGVATTVYLRVAPGTLRARLEGGMEDRPSLTGGDPLDEIDEIFAHRDPRYQEIADVVLEPSGGVEATARELLTRLGDQAASE